MSENWKKEEALVQSAIKILTEHFDTVHIFVTRRDAADGDGTFRMCDGIGNWFARYGQIRTWLIQQDEKSKIQVHEEMEEE